MLHYRLTLDTPSSHLFLVEISTETNGASSIDLEFPSWSPGRYYIYDFAKNVQELTARGESGAKLRATKVEKARWRVEAMGEERITISYRMYGDSLSGTFSQLDDRHAAVNGSSLFGYIVGSKYEPIELEIIGPESWRAYSSLKKKRRASATGKEAGKGLASITTYAAENYDVLIDSPIEIGTPIARRFEHDGIRYHMIIDIAGAEGTRRSREVRERIEKYVDDTSKIVRAYVDTFGRPEFDDYYFLVNIDPYAGSGDGMEHLASTRLVLNGYITSDESYADLLDVTSHEFFHIWNVKRMRPAELGPFDYTRELHTTLLWFAEGFTQYYGHLMVRRAGVWDDRQFFKELVGEINAVDKSPGRSHRNLRDSSFDTWLAAGSRSPGSGSSNFRNTWVNYYNKGAVVALALDMELRRITADRKSLDDVMRELYRRSYHESDHGEYFLRGSGYTEQDVYDAITAVAGRSLRAFLRHAIESTEEIDYAKYLKHVGVTLGRGDDGTAGRRDGGKKKEEEKKRVVYTGMVAPDGKGKTGEFVTLTNVIPGSPAEKAGLSIGDMVIAIDGERVDAKRWEAVMGMKRPGESLELTIFRGTPMMYLPVETD
jgi:predicted metalloprotease with PDZ domain